MTTNQNINQMEGGMYQVMKNDKKQVKYYISVGCTEHAQRVAEQYPHTNYIASFDTQAEAINKAIELNCGG